MRRSSGDSIPAEPATPESGSQQQVPPDLTMKGEPELDPQMMTNHPLMRWSVAAMRIAVLVVSIATLVAMVVILVMKVSG